MLSCFNIVLVEPEIPSNTGNIARLCAATKSKLHLIHPLGFRLDDTALKRAGMDYLDIATIIEYPSLSKCLRGQSSVYYLTKKRGAAYWNAKFKTGDFLVFGRETKGLPEELISQNESRCFTIPMGEPQVRSLNLATSVAVVLYEAIRQQNKS